MLSGDGTALQRPHRLAEGNGFGKYCLRRYGRISQTRNLQPDRPDSTRCSFDPQAHYSNREFLRFLRHSRGSLAELETQILIAQRRNYLSESDTAVLLKRADEVSRILSGLINSLREKTQ